LNSTRATSTELLSFLAEIMNKILAFNLKILLTLYNSKIDPSCALCPLEKSGKRMLTNILTSPKICDVSVFIARNHPILLQYKVELADYYYYFVYYYSTITQTTQVRIFPQNGAREAGVLGSLDGLVVIMTS
jgi:hypothetical protein